MEFDPQQLIQLREQRVLSISEFAEFLNVPVSSLSRWEKGIQAPRLKRLRQIAKALGVEPETLLKKKGRK